jgi:hypothetical protein
VFSLQFLDTCFRVNGVFIVRLFAPSATRHAFLFSSARSAAVAIAIIASCITNNTAAW